MIITLYLLIDSSFWFDTINLEWFIVYIEGLHVIFCKQIVILSLKIIFVLANSVDPNEMPHNAAFHLGLHCMPKHIFRRSH